MLVAFAIVTAQLASAASAAWSGARPTECAPLASPSASNVWERAKHAPLQRYCDRLASGAARLASGGGVLDAQAALASADDADHAVPGHAAPDVLRGRALVALGEWARAEAAMDSAAQKDPGAMSEPAALLARARALARMGRTADAEAALQTLLPRAADLPPAERGRAELEAGFLAEVRGPAGLDDAIAHFRQATRDAQDSLLQVAALALPLALDRAGEHEESRLAPGAGTLRRDPREVVADARVAEALADVGTPFEADALAAFALAEKDPAGARDLWTKFVAGAGGKGPWADHARARLQQGPGRALSASASQLVSRRTK